MNDKLKCPFCQQEIMCMDAQDADEHSTWYCPRCIAERAWYAFGNETLWQELIRTRKALDRAKDTLHWYNDNYDSVVAQETINEITALEQKE
jgi:hypothetical protein